MSYNNEISVSIWRVSYEWRNDDGSRLLNADGHHQNHLLITLTPTIHAVKDKIKELLRDNQYLYDLKEATWLGGAWLTEHEIEDLKGGSHE